jgi:hypothetical protein
MQATFAEGWPRLWLYHTCLFAGRKGSAEVGITRRIHFIYERATRKFKADLSLWLAWLQYCRRAKSHTLLSKVRIGDPLQL